jgi:hypothetical protein
MPSISPSTAAGAPRMEITNLAISEVGTSYPNVGREARRPDPARPRGQPRPALRPDNLVL